MMKQFKKLIALMLCLCMVFTVVPMDVLAEESAQASTESNTTSDETVTDAEDEDSLKAALDEAKAFIDALTINNGTNDPATVVGNFGKHFTWDNEKRENSKSYLFDWSYYNGVVFEGLEYVYEVTKQDVYKDYVIEYLNAMIDEDGNWKMCSNNSDKQCAGYHADHGADCYKTASLLLDAYQMTGDDRYLKVADALYIDLSTALISYALPNAGYNWRHTWASDSNPDLWLDGLYMILPFRAEYAKYKNGTEGAAELTNIVNRLQWVSDNMYNADKGLFYHAADSADSNSGTYWLRSMGWYAAAMADVMDSMSGDNLETMKVQLKKMVDGMKACQNADNGMWLNNMNAAHSSSNPYETSGTALICYAVMKAVNNGWLDASYADMAVKAFEGICNEKLDGTTLKDICFKGAPGSSNSTFYDNEGKGVGPFIMLYAETLEYYNNKVTGITVTAPTEVEYTVGEELSLDGLVVKGTTNGGKTVDVKYTVDTSKVDMTVAGEYTVTVTAEGFEKTFTITVKELAATQTGITVTAPTKVEYTVGEELSLGDLVVKGTMSDGTTVDVEYTVDTSKVDMTTAGEYTVTVTSGEYTETFTVTVKEPEVTEPTDTTEDVTVGEGDDKVDATISGVLADLVVEVLKEADKAILDVVTGKGKTYANYIALEVTATIKEGEKVTITMPIPAGWVATGKIVGISVEDGKVVEIEGTVNEEDNTFSFEVEHFSAKGIALVAEPLAEGETSTGTGTVSGDMQEVTGHLKGDGTAVTTTVYKLVTELKNGGKYLIVNRNTAGSGYAMGSTTTGTSVTVNAATTDIDAPYITDKGNALVWTASTGWKFASGSYNLGVSVGGSMMNRTFTLSTSTDSSWSYSSNRLSYTYYNYYTRYLTCSSSGNWSVSDSNSNVYFYEETTITTGSVGDDVILRGPVSATMNAGQTVTLTPTVLVNNEAASKYTITWASADESVATVDNGVVTGVKGGTVNITVTLTSANDTEMAEDITLTIPVTVNNVVEFTVTPGSVSVTPNGEKDLVATVILNGKEVDLSDCTITWVSSDTTKATVSNGTVKGVAVGTTTITATLTKVDGITVNKTVAIPVTVSEKTITSITYTQDETFVYKGAGSQTLLGTITVHYDNGDTETVDMALEHTSLGTKVNTAGKYSGLTVTYMGVDAEKKMTLTVREALDANYPEFPDPGSVILDKYISDSEHFQDTGVAQITLSAAGLPALTGVDVILVTDLSNSMAWSAGGRTDATSHSATKMYDLQQAVSTFASTFLDAEGSKTQNTISLVTFGGYDADHTNKVYTAYADPTQTLLVGATDAAVVSSTVGNIRVLADDALNIGTSTTGYYLSFDGGKTYGENYGNTNYDYAFMETYDAVQALKDAYAANNNGKSYDASGRSIYVLFMTDGAPSNYDGVYFNTKSGDRADVNATWINAEGNEVTYTMTSNDKNVTGWYNIIAGGDYDEDTDTIPGNPLYWADKVYNLSGVKNIYPIGFDLDNGGFSSMVFTESTGCPLDKVLEKLVTGQTLRVESADNADKLEEIYASLAAEIKLAATNAYFVDQMGGSFNLQMSNTITKFDDTNKETVITLTPRPQIEVSTQKIYTADDVANGVEGAELGQVYGDRTVLETVTFSDDGKMAYSNGGSTNIMSGGVIYANTFFYNTNATAVMIDTDGDGKTDYSLPAETFRWNIGTITNEKFTMTYYVYLEGSAEGKRPAGSYATNNYATLYYKNWLGNDAEQSVDTPTTAWKSATVYYGFYLVDTNGKPVINRATGATGDFANAVKVTPRIFYEEIFLNDVTQLTTIKVSSTAVPEGYKVYDAGAAYTITIDSGKTVSGWDIINGKTPATTYVTDYKGSEYTNVLSSSGNSTYDYTSTTVWFAVVWEPSTVPDQVVIDFGLPVDIGVLENDLFGTAGELVGIGLTNPVSASNSYTTSLDSAFKTELSMGTNGLKYGHAEINIKANEVRYSVQTMQMNGYEKFYYAVKYKDSNGVVGYYYGEVKVIPATTIYYEDDLAIEYTTFTYDNSEVPEANQWTQVGDRVENATQDEDRPGKHSLPSIDANNIYGYDSAYKEMSTYSLGSAAKVTVNANTFAEAQFTFYGTGFDVISLTSNTTGTVLVDVYKGTNVTYQEKDIIKSYMVDTFYGYTQNANGDWVVTPNTKNALYQVPVMEISGLTYGQYTVVITVAYAELFDHNDKGTYDFYLDAIRIYDPANDGASDGSDDTTIEDAYIADNEGWPTYVEIRNNVIDAATAAGSETINGVVFIDSADKVFSVADYTNFGPNNELYLAPGQAIVFQLDLSNVVADKVHIGIKSATDATPVSYKIFDASTISVQTDLDKVEAKSISTTTAMYYDITDLKDCPIMVYNSDDSGMLSLTDIKITFGTDPAGKATNLLTVSTDTLAKIKENLNAQPTFVPEKLRVSTTKAYVDAKFAVTVTTSADVASVAVNGGDPLTSYYKDASGNLVWTAWVTAGAEAGEQTVSVVAYNEDGIASETKTVKVEVEKNETVSTIVSLVSKLKSWFNW